MWKQLRRKWLGALAIGLAALSGAGTASAAKPALYHLIAPRPAQEAAPRWAKQFAGFDEVVGYSVLGHLFMHNRQAGTYAVIYPYKAAGKNYGAFKDVAEFERKILKDDYFDKVILLRKHVADIRQRKGALKPEQVYIARPYPFLGGSEAPDTYDKGDVWVFLDIVAQAHGL